MPLVNPVIVIGLALPVAVCLSTLDWQVPWYCTEAAAAEFVGVNVIATLRSLGLASRIETALGRAAGGPATGSVVVPQAMIDTLRKNADSNDGFMRTSHPVALKRASQIFVCDPSSATTRKLDENLHFSSPSALRRTKAKWGERATLREP
jgi:hypothetical protein